MAKSSSKDGQVILERTFQYCGIGDVPARIGLDRMDGVPGVSADEMPKFTAIVIKEKDLTQRNMPPFYRKLCTEQITALYNWVLTNKESIPVEMLELYWPYHFNPDGTIKDNHDTCTCADPVDPADMPKYLTHQYNGTPMVTADGATNNGAGMPRYLTHQYLGKPMATTPTVERITSDAAASDRAFANLRETPAGHFECMATIHDLEEELAEQQMEVERLTEEKDALQQTIDEMAAELEDLESINSMPPLLFNMLEKLRKVDHN